MEVKEQNTGGSPVPESTGNTNQNTDNGQGSQSVIDWAKMDVTAIPDDVIKQHPAYAAILTESVERRKQLAAMKKNETVTPEKVNTNDPVMNEILKLAAKIETVTAELATSKLETARNNALTAFGLPPEAMTFLTGETLDEIQAQATLLRTLGANKAANTHNTLDTKTNGMSPGNPATGGGNEALKAALKARMGGSTGVSAFSPGVQATKGGGILKND